MVSIPSASPPPSARCTTPCRLCCGNGTAAATASSPTLTLPCALLPRRITQQQQQQHVNPYPTHHHQHPHHLQHSHQHVLLHGQGRRQSLESYRLPLVTAGPVAVTGASATPTATTATNSPALSDRGNPSCRVVPTPSLVRDIPRAMFEVSDISDKSSDTSDEDPEECGISLRLPPLQPCPSHLKLIRSSVDGDLGPRPRQPGHSFFTDSQDEFDGWQQQQQQQQPQQQQQQPSHCHSPHGIGRFLPAAFRNQQPPFLQCRSGPAMGAGGAGGGGGGGGGNGDGDVAAGSVSQLRSSSCTSVSSRTLPAAAVAAALGTTLSGEGHGGGLSSASPLRPSGCGGILQPYARDEHLLPVAKPILSPMQVDAAALGSASGCASAAGFSATAVPAGGGGGGGGGCAATLTSSLSPVGSVTAAAPSPPPPSAVKPQTAWPAITPTMMQTPTSPSLPVLTSPRCPAVSGVATTAAAASAAVALTSSVQAVDSVQALVRSHPFPPSPAAAFITAAASPEPTVTAPSQPQPTAPSNLHAVQLQPQLQPQDQTAPRDGYAPAEIACLSIGSPDGAAAAAAVPVIRRRQPVPPPMPPASRSRRGLLSSVTEESIAAAGAAAAAATTAVIAITAAATSENL
ncbi:hypothetical protein Vretimale_7602 [Volvox reticuliferus]|uniref:Uncharacterized protein n=1 Tax=Volvox reticuliferus TaxID=1737510 RepID=A0A8J4LND2_9CHLO|nr:hypothetical protein Vretimale_7602 [Volvox reticuliferus]